MAVPALIGALGFMASKSMAKANKAETPPQTQPVANTTVDPQSQPADPSASANAAKGRAALIATSPSGVLGTDPTGRRRLLGN